MATPIVFVNYPPELLCYSSFERKMKSILSSLEDTQLLCIDDPNRLVHKFSASGALKLIPFQPGKSLACFQNVTHAILFEDSRDLETTETKLPSLDGLRVRRIKLNLTKVVNIDKGEPYDIYIGRGSGWGNPYAIGFDGNRDEVLEKFQYDFERGFLPGDRADKVKIRGELAGKRLGCHCKPEPCHGDVFARYLNSLDYQD